MRVVHVPFGYYPDAVGGTEAYVAELARGLRARGVDSVVAAPAGSLGAHRYDHDGTPVYRFAMSPTDDVGELYGAGDPDAASAVSRILDEVRADEPQTIAQLLQEDWRNPKPLPLLLRRNPRSRDAPYLSFAG